MKLTRQAVTLMLAAAILLLSGPAGGAAAQNPETLAILPFENNSITDPDRYAPLSKGLSAMLITDLSKSQTALKLIERGKIAALLKEIALGQSGGVDEATAVRAGKILGARCIAFGSFMVIGKQMRIDTRIIKVETSELLMAESIQGKKDDFMALEQNLAGKIAAALNVELKDRSAPAESDIDAALCFSRGLDLLDNGDKQAARQMFKKCIELDPAYQAQVDLVQGMEP